MSILTYQKMTEVAADNGRSIKEQIDCSLAEEKRLKDGLLKDYPNHNEITKAFITLQVEKLNKRISRYDWMLNKNDSDDISEEAIQQARDYPIANLIDFNRAGKAMAWCHEDKNPSLVHWKPKNKCRCFVCNETFDTIAVLMGRDGYTFVEAIKALT